MLNSQNIFTVLFCIKDLLSIYHRCSIFYTVFLQYVPYQICTFKVWTAPNSMLLSRYIVGILCYVSAVLRNTWIMRKLFWFVVLQRVWYIFQSFYLLIDLAVFLNISNQIWYGGEGVFTTASHQNDTEALWQIFGFHVSKKRREKSMQISLFPFNNITLFYIPASEYSKMSSLVYHACASIPYSSWAATRS